MAVITISRQFGAGAMTLGKGLSERLGYHYVNREIIKDMAQEIKVSYDDIRAFENLGSKAFMKVLDKIVSTDFIERLVSEKYGYVDEERYVKVLTAIVKKIYAEDNAVIIGRGAQYILRGLENTWHILLIADPKHRTDFLMEQFNLTKTDAERAMRRSDRSRNLILSCFDDTLSHDDPRLYDLVINTTRVTMEKAEGMVVSLVSS
ncbi:MAG: cytidylate kinase-like family protein [Thermodesulfobacteriota bacterium]|nr:cytidylate kinase-like family protein [Thermodesulfobacteriota bacterium]